MNDDKIQSPLSPVFIGALSLSALVLTSFSQATPPPPAPTSNLQISSTALDSDGDGITDLQEKQLGTERFLKDTDGDGISDGKEVGDDVSNPLDHDNDKRIDALDSDDDNDGLPTIFEKQTDTDRDKIPDYLDSDSDNDGILDGDEAGMTAMDMDEDGIDNFVDVDSTGDTDLNGDGISDNTNFPDTNNNGIPDFLDKKVQYTNANPTDTKEPVSNTQLETEVTTTEMHDSSLTPNLDTDHDGLPDIAEKKIGTNINKRDSDNDGVNDALEVGLVIDRPQDSDRDGIIDALDTDDDNDGILTRNEDPNKDGSPLNDDIDNDGVPNYQDANDDGDNRLTKDEGGTRDSDKDGVPDYLDKDDGYERLAKAKSKATKQAKNTLKSKAAVNKQSVKKQLTKHIDDAKKSLAKNTKATEKQLLDINPQIEQEQAKIKKASQITSLKPN